MISVDELLQRQGLPLRLKLLRTIVRVQEYYEHHDGMIYVAFSGGLDSTVLAHIVRQMYPEVPVVFCNTGQEHPSIAAFATSYPGVVVIRPAHSYKWVLDHHGYPVPTKAVAVAVSRYRTAKDDVQRNLRLYGGINPRSGKMQRLGVIPKRWHFLVDAPFKISDKCCDVLKKNPFKKYAKEAGSAAMTGELASDSNARKMQYLEHGCNFYGKAHKSTPLGPWMHQDILEYLRDYNVPYCTDYYGEIVQTGDGKLKTTKGFHSGCCGCMFGVPFEDPNRNRFHIMREEDPVRYKMFIERFGQGKVLDYIGVKY